MESVTSSLPAFATTAALRSEPDKLSRKHCELPHSIHQKSTFPHKPIVPAQEPQKDSMRLQIEDQSGKIQELESKLDRYMPVSKAHFDKAMADLKQTLKPVHNRDELTILHGRIHELTYERDGARAKADQLEEAMETTVEDRCYKMKEDYDASMDAKIAKSLGAASKELKEMRKDRDRCSERADSLLKKLSTVECNYNSLLQREERSKDDLRAEINALQKIVREMEEATKVRNARASPPTRSSSRLAGMAREQDVKHKRKIDQLTKERDSALAQVSALSHHQDTPRKRPRR